MIPHSVSHAGRDAGRLVSWIARAWLARRSPGLRADRRPPRAPVFCATEQVNDADAKDLCPKMQAGNRDIDFPRSRICRLEPEESNQPSQRTTCIWLRKGIQVRPWLSCRPAAGCSLCFRRQLRLRKPSPSEVETEALAAGTAALPFCSDQPPATSTIFSLKVTFRAPKPDRLRSS